MTQISAFESGTYQSGTYTQIATTQAEAEALMLEQGVVYEHRITTSGPISTAVISAFEGALLTLQQLFGMVRVTYWKAEGNQIVYQFTIPSGQAVGLIAPILWAVIVIVIAAIAIIAIVGWVVFRVDVFGFGTVIKLIPGMAVTIVGGIVMSVLPGKAKIAGVVPLGIGLWMMLQPFIPPSPGPACSDYTTEADCAAKGCYWYDGACHSSPKPEPGTGAEIEKMSVA